MATVEPLGGTGADARVFGEEGLAEAAGELREEPEMVGEEAEGGLGRVEANPPVEGVLRVNEVLGW